MCVPLCELIVLGVIGLRDMVRQPSKGPQADREGRQELY